MPINHIKSVANAFWSQRKMMLSSEINSSLCHILNGMIEELYAQEHFIIMSGLKLNHGTQVYLSMQTGLSFAKCLYNHRLFALEFSGDHTSLISLL